LREWANIKAYGHERQDWLTKANPSEFKDQTRLLKWFPEFHRASLGLPMNWTLQLQEAWRELDTRWKTMLLARLLSNVMESAAVNRQSLFCPNPKHFWADNVADALICAIQIPERLRVCSNPECPAPLFIAKRPKQQRQCSPECAAWAQRQSKLKWWEHHKEEQLAMRKAEYRKRRKRAPRRKKSSWKGKRK
jgi:hypothetical protein